jgi:hypothetical protein
MEQEIMSTDEHPTPDRRDGDDPFSSRPPKPDRRCSCCSGLGVIPDPYWLRADPGGIGLRGSREDVIVAWVSGSASIFEAAREASEIARRTGRPVEFRFIDRTVSVAPPDDPEVVARAWWREFYGETPEQTAARR